jgi:hypothetical protein
MSLDAINPRHAAALAEARTGCTRGIRAIALVRAANIRRRASGLPIVQVYSYTARQLGRAGRRRLGRVRGQMLIKRANEATAAIIRAAYAAEARS